MEIRNQIGIPPISTLAELQLWSAGVLIPIFCFDYSGTPSEPLHNQMLRSMLKFSVNSKSRGAKYSKKSFKNYRTQST